MPAKGDNHRLFLDCQHRRRRGLRTSRNVGDRGPSLPFGDRLLIDTVTLRQSPQALLTMLYRSTDCLRRAGAPMKNLAHSASFDSDEKNAPSKSGIKHLGKTEKDAAIGAAAALVSIERMSDGGRLGVSPSRSRAAMRHPQRNGSPFRFRTIAGSPVLNSACLEPDRRRLAPRVWGSYLASAGGVWP